MIQSSNLPSEPDPAGLHRAYSLLTVDVERAISELKCLADKGSVGSTLYLGDAMEKSGKPHDALRWYEEAFNRGAKLGGYFLGRLQLDLKDYDSARTTFEDPRLAHYGPTLHQLGRMYFLGTGVRRDFLVAKNSLEEGSRLGNLFARRLLGELLVRGSFGLVQKLRGMWLMLSSVASVPFAIAKDSQSDRLR